MDYLGASGKEKIEMQIDNALYQLHTTLPAIITDVDLQNQTLNAKPAIKRTVNIDGVLSELEYPPLAKIPFFTLQNKGYSVTVAPKVGDACMLIFCERNADGFWSDGTIKTPPYAQMRRHDINDAIAIIGFTPATKKISEYGSDGIEIRNAAKTSCISLTDENIQVRINDVTMIITPEGITINGNKPITYNVSKFTVNATDDIVFNNIGHSIDCYTTVFNVTGNMNQTGETATFTDEKLEITAYTHQMGDMGIDGAVSVKGDLDAVLLKGPVVPEKNLKATDATPGILTTGYLYSWDDFTDKLTLDGKNVRFKLMIAEQTYEVNIPYTQIKQMGSYENLAAEIATQCNNQVTVVFNMEVNNLVLTTVGEGKELGHLTYLLDIITQTNSIPGVLTTGAFGSWHDFRSSLKNLGLLFKINIGGNFQKYKIDYSTLTEQLGWTGFAGLLNDTYPKIVGVTFVNNSLVFTTIKGGTMDGLISWLTFTSSEALPAVLTSGIFDAVYGNFVNGLQNKDFGVISSINGNNSIFYMSYADVASFNNYTDFFEELFGDSALEPDVDFNTVVFSTHKTGSSASIGYFSAVTHIDATAAYLTTGLLADFNQIKNLYSSQPLNIIFNLNVDSYVNNYTITPQNLQNSNNWSDIAGLLTPTGDGTTSINISYQQGSFIFASPTTGEREFSYLEYNPDPQVQSISGAALLNGVAGTATIYPGTDVKDNISSEGASLLHLTKETGATTTNGKDVEYNSDSIHLLKGTKDSGAILTPGKDGQITIINNSATLLKGTKEKDAVLIPGADAGEEPPGTYDRVMTIVGSLEVIEKITCANLEAKEKVLLNGEIKVNPRTVPEDEYQPAKEADMIVDGGIQVKNLKVLETATVDELVINNGVTMTGDLNMDGGKIINNGIQLSFKWTGLNVNNEIQARDFIAGKMF